MTPSPDNDAAYVAKPSVPQSAERDDARGDRPRRRFVHEHFEDRARHTPDAPAVVFESERASYSELNRRANKLARHLRDLGVGRDTLVGIYLERSIELVAAVLAVLKAGGAFVPLDPANPRERTAFMIEDARLAVIVTQRSLRDSLPQNME